MDIPTKDELAAVIINAWPDHPGVFSIKLCGLAAEAVHQLLIRRDDERRRLEEPATIGCDEEDQRNDGEDDEDVRASDDELSKKDRDERKIEHERTLADVRRSVERERSLSRKAAWFPFDGDGGD